MSIKLFGQFNESLNTSDYSSVFIRTEQEEIISQLQKEIKKLRQENSDFKFSICLPHDVQINWKPKDVNEFPRISGQKDSALKKDKSAKRLIKDASKDSERLEVKELKNELEAARNMIEDLNWVKIHHETKIRSQELKIEELQREIKVLKSTELELVHIQIPGIVSSRCSMESPTTRSSSKRRSASLSRRGSTQSVLPTNYKESVATLPPISKQKSLENDFK